MAWRRRASVTVPSRRMLARTVAGAIAGQNGALAIASGVALVVPVAVNPLMHGSE